MRASWGARQDGCQGDWEWPGQSGTTDLTQALISTGACHAAAHGHLGQQHKFVVLFGLGFVFL